MRRAGYQALGFAVWNGGKWYLRRRYGHLVRPVVAGVLVAGGVSVCYLAWRRADLPA